jgi:hypothetical protein
MGEESDYNRQIFLDKKRSGLYFEGRRELITIRQKQNSFPVVLQQ